MLSLLFALVPVPGTAQSYEFYTDGTNFVYREDQSCALYVDFPDDAMLRVSYRHYSRSTFFSVVGGPWDAVAVGEAYMTVIHNNVTPNVRQAFSSRGIIQPGDDNRRGVAAQRGEELLPLLREATSITINTDGRFRATYSVRGMPVAMDKLIACSMAYFGVAPSN